MEHAYLKAYLQIEKMDIDITCIGSKAKTIPTNFNKVSLKLEFVKIFIASLPVYHFG